MRSSPPFPRVPSQFATLGTRGVGPVGWGGRLRPACRPPWSSAGAREPQVCGGRAQVRAPRLPKAVVCNYVEPRWLLSLPPTRRVMMVQEKFRLQVLERVHCCSTVAQGCFEVASLLREVKGKSWSDPGIVYFVCVIFGALRIFLESTRITVKGNVT